MRDIGERAAVDECRVVFQRLHEIGGECILEQHRHCAMHLQIGSADRLLVFGVRDNDVAEALFQILERSGETENRHHFRSHHDIEAVLARIAVGGAAEADGDVTQGAVVHVYHALPLNAADVDAQLVAVADVVVNGGRKQIVGQRNGGEVTGKVQVDVFHRYDLRIAAAGCTALDAEHRAERRFAQGDDGLLAQMIERVAQTDRGGGLAFASRCQVDGSDEDQFAVGLVLERFNEVERQLGLVMAVRHQMVVADAQLLFCHLGDTLHGGGLGNLNVGLWHA